MPTEMPQKPPPTKGQRMFASAVVTAMCVAAYFIHPALAVAAAAWIASMAAGTAHSVKDCIERAARKLEID